MLISKTPLVRSFIKLGIQHARICAGCQNCGVKCKNRCNYNDILRNIPGVQETEQRFKDTSLLDPTDIILIGQSVKVNLDQKYQ